MKALSLIAAAYLLALPAAAAATYECTDGQGRRTYTATPGPHCKDANLGKPSVYSSAPVPQYRSTPAAIESPAPQAETALPNPSSGSAAALRAAEERLRQAQHNLEEGRKVRHGNERNYARYLERVKDLEDAAAAAQKEVDNLKQQP